MVLVSCGGDGLLGAESEDPGLESECVFRDVMHKNWWWWWWGKYNLLTRTFTRQCTHTKKGGGEAVEFEARRGWGWWGLHLFLKEEKEM